MTIWNLLDERHLGTRLHRSPAILGEPARWYCLLYDPEAEGMAVGFCRSMNDKDIIIPCGIGRDAIEAINNLVEIIRGSFLTIQDMDSERGVCEFIPVPVDVTI